MRSIFVHMLPDFLDGVDLTNGTAVVIDILRATTTIVHAVAAGAEAIVPCLTVEEALKQANDAGDPRPLLGGERHGRRIDGFDLGNSPLSYVSGVVAGKRILFTTTNGTRALLRCCRARSVVIGAFVNRQAVVRRLLEESGDVHLMCAGTDGQLTAEDILFAGAIAADLQAQGADWTVGNIQTQMAIDYFLARTHDLESFKAAFLGSLGALNLIELEMEEDIERAMQENLFDLVPIWNSQTGEIRRG